MKKHLTLLTILSAFSTQAAITYTQVEDAMAAAGYADSLYLDLHNTAYTHPDATGVTLTWANWTSGDWGYPDGSDNQVYVGGFGLDENNNGSGSNVQAVFSGLDANSQYTFWTTLLVNKSGSQTRDFAWGLSEATITTIASAANGGPIVANDDLIAPYTDQVPIASTTTYSNNAFKLGTFTTDASGNFTIWLGEGVSGGGRTQLDGLVVTPVPEPATIALALGLLSLGAVLLRRRVLRG
jgi:uncharacterized protein (TIGR03382 family)